MVITVDELLDKPFLNRSREERLKIVREGKPRPSLPFLKSKETTESLFQQGAYDQLPRRTIVFDMASYDHVEWLTGCNVRQALYCWSCLLFRFETDPWNRSGVRDLDDLRQRIDTHEKCISHIQSSLDLRLFLPQAGGGDEQEPTAADEELVKRNREVARRIIDSACALAAERHRNRLTAEDCVKNLRLIRDYDIAQIAVVDDAIELLRSSPGVLDDVARAVGDVLRASIRVDLQQCAFASLVLNEHSRELGKSLASVVVRYVGGGGRACERFVEFVAGRDDERTFNATCRPMRRVVRDLDVSQKLVAFSLDSPVYPDSVVYRQYTECAREREGCFIPCHFHRLDHVVRQSAYAYDDSGREVCDVFFKNLESLRSCFRRGPVPDEFRGGIVETAAGTSSDFLRSPDRSEFLVAVKLHRKSCVRFLERRLGVDGRNVAKTLGLCSFLKDFKTYFLLEMFSKFLSATLPLEEALYGTGEDVELDRDLVDRIKKSLLIESDVAGMSPGETHSHNAFNDFYLGVIEGFEEAEKPVSKETSDEMNNRLFYSTLYASVWNSMVNQVRNRYLKHEKLGLFNVLALKRKGKPLNSDYVKRVAVASAYGSNFDYANLQKEMASLEDNADVLDCESVYQLTEVFLKSGLNLSCPNLYRLMELVLTLPCSPPNPEDGDSKLADLTGWLRSSDDESKNIFDSSLMFIERDYLEELRKKSSFHDKVMVLFEEKNKTLQLS